ncbi:MAG: thioredoxin family protein [Arcobacter sp.]|nr:thioredoxin family protein [Arcobacter sp.]
MKKILMIVLFGLSAANANLVWQSNLNKATIEAKQSKKNIFILVESNHCRWCKLLKETTLSDPKIQTKLGKFILVKIIREEAAKYALPPIIGVPTIFVVTPDKKITEQGVGYLESEDMNNVISRFNARVKLKK